MKTYLKKTKYSIEKMNFCSNKKLIVTKIIRNKIEIFFNSTEFSITTNPCVQHNSFPFLKALVSL